MLLIKGSTSRGKPFLHSILVNKAGYGWLTPAILIASRPLAAAGAQLNSSGKCSHKDVDEGNTDCRCNSPPGFFDLHGSFLPSGSLIGGKLSDIPRTRTFRTALAVDTR